MSSLRSILLFLRLIYLQTTIFTMVSALSPSSSSSKAQNLVGKGTLVGTGILGGLGRVGQEQKQQQQLRKLYPPIEPYNIGRLEVGSDHSVYYEECGNPNGKPVVFIHGGPGGGCTKENRCFFDPELYRIILMDQRGAGRSTPTASLTDNTTWDLVRDMELLRTTLNIEKWMCFGGSWGSTLALVYAIEHPGRVTELVLRGIFLIKEEELSFFYQQGTSMIFPDAYQTYSQFIPEGEERDNLIHSYYKRLTSEDKTVRELAAKYWTTWEMSTSFAKPKVEYIAKGDDPEFAAAFARIETHYFVNLAWLPTPNHILENIDTIRHIPTVFTHGRYDVVCPFKSAFDLSQAFPEATFIVCGQSGHSAGEEEHTSELVMACDRFANK
mmetsp:Transcript_6082/g.6564  ORF Transcript_6082/g.6564 Transcript_6082/m.6564 type:complete len:383 (-) Transcript_6082:118-1266(-)